MLDGPIGVGDSEFYPFLNREIVLIRHRLDHRRPTLGMCLGAQLMAAALDAAVRPGNGVEIGYAPLELTEQGLSDLHLGVLPAPVCDDGPMPSSVELIRSSALSDAAEYAYAATAPREARLVFLAGSCPLNLDGTTAAIGDYAGQAAKCLENMQLALEAAGATIRDVTSTRVLVVSNRQSDLVAAWEVVRDAFGDHDVPSTLMGVTVLGYDDQLVEVDAVAAVVDGNVG